MASSVEPIVRTPFTVVETSTLDNTWNTSVMRSSLYKLQRIQNCRQVRTANCKEELYELDRCTTSWGLSRVRVRGHHLLWVVKSMEMVSKCV